MSQLAVRASSAVALATLLVTSGCTTVARGTAASATTAPNAASTSSATSTDSSDTDSASPSTDASSEDSSAGDDSGGLVTTTVGHAAKTSKMSVTVKKVTDPASPDPSSLFKPQAGKKWVAVNLEVTNLADKPLDFSSMFCMRAKTDANTQATSSMLSPYGTPLSSQTLQKNDTASGDVVYEIPQEQKVKTIDFKCDLDFQGDQRTIRVDLTN